MRQKFGVGPALFLLAQYNNYSILILFLFMKIIFYFVQLINNYNNFISYEMYKNIYLQEVFFLIKA